MNGNQNGRVLMCSTTVGALPLRWRSFDCSTLFRSGDGPILLAALETDAGMGTQGDRPSCHYGMSGGV